MSSGLLILMNTRIHQVARRHGPSPRNGLCVADGVLIFGHSFSHLFDDQLSKNLSPIRAAIIYALEPVWAALIAVSIGQTQIDGWLISVGHHSYWVISGWNWVENLAKTESITGTV